MATAAFQLSKFTGTTASNENDSSYNPCFLDEDSNGIDTANHPVGVPLDGGADNYSYEVWLKLKCTARPNGICDNFKFWGANAIPATGVTLYGATRTTEAGVTPVKTVSSYATTQMDTNYYSVGTALTIAITNETSNQIDAVGEYTDWIILQMKVESTASRGSVTTMIFYLQYDES